MSDSSPDFDRSQLERKDREQLVVIATTLGKKPPSRARKAEIVDLILELAGVTSASDGAGDTGGKPQQPETVEHTDARNEADHKQVGQDQSRQDQGRQDQGGQDQGRQDQGGQDQGGQDQSRQDKGGQDKGGQHNNRHRKDGKGGSDNTGGGRNGADSGGKKSGQERSSDGGQNDSKSGGGSSQNQPSGSGNENKDDSNRGGNDNQGDSQARRRRRRGRGQGNQGDNQPEPEPIEVDGILDLRDDGYGFLRLHSYLADRDDSYVSVKQVRQFGLRKGDRIKGLSRPPTRSEKNPALLRIDEVNGAEPSLARDRPNFADLTPEYPTEALRLEHPDTIIDMTGRIIDLVTPIGKGQRGLIVAPPKSGKTTVLKTIARAIEQNHPECHLMVVLVDERPEEVTDLQRWVREGEVVSSTFDRPAEEHTIVAELAVERAKRMAEAGGDVVMLVDGITRLTRAYNLTVKESGRLMSGGIDAAAIWPAKRFFGAARKLAEGGSLTILATALVDTNSRMDDHIFEEFKGTGNAELRLDRRLAEARVFPAIDIAGSGTRHEELLFSKPQQTQITKLRRVLAGVADDQKGPGAAMELLIERLQAFKSNEEFLSEVSKS